MLALLILILHIPIILIWLLGLTVSAIVRPKQEQIHQFLQTFLHLPTLEEFKHGVFWTTQLFFKTLSDHAFSAFSVLLDLLTGYGYKPGRTLFWYFVVFWGFANIYYILAPLVKVYENGIQKDVHLSYIGALIFSITAFHGRGFFLGGDFGYDSFVTILAAIEAVIGLFIEISFIATFTGRFFRR